MGLPLGPTFANLFLCFHENKWLEECPSEYKPKIYRRYINDTFLLLGVKSFMIGKIQVEFNQNSGA